MYYRDTLLNSWLSYNTGLPNVIVNDLQIFYPTNTLLAATYGRGIWNSPTYVTGINTVTNENNGFKVYPNPTTGKIKFDVDITDAGKYALSVYNVMGQKVYSNTINISGHYTSQLDLSDFSKGLYLFTLSGPGQTLEKKIVLN